MTREASVDEWEHNVDFCYNLSLGSLFISVLANTKKKHHHYECDHYFKCLVKIWYMIYNWTTAFLFDFFLSCLNVTQSHLVARQIEEFVLGSALHINRSNKYKQFTEWYLLPALHAEQMLNHALQIQAKLVFTNETLLWNSAKPSWQCLAEAAPIQIRKIQGWMKSCVIHNSQHFTD